MVVNAFAFFDSIESNSWNVGLFMSQKLKLVRYSSNGKGANSLSDELAFEFAKVTEEFKLSFETYLGTQKFRKFVVCLIVDSRSKGCDIALYFMSGLQATDNFPQITLNLPLQFLFLDLDLL